VSSPPPTLPTLPGFSNGLFELYQMPEFSPLQTLSISSERVTAAAFNTRGDWLALGCAKLGQLLVWEWGSEGYVLRQQGHFYDVACAAYSPDGALVATGADDAKVCVRARARAHARARQGGGSAARLLARVAARMTRYPLPSCRDLTPNHFLRAATPPPPPGQGVPAEQRLLLRHVQRARRPRDGARVPALWRCRAERQPGWVGARV
jgi:hypothetical protein